MDGSSDTDLSSSLESYQSCPDDESTGIGFKEQLTLGVYSCPIAKDVNHQRDELGSGASEMVGALNYLADNEGKFSDDDDNIATSGGTFRETNGDTPAFFTPESKCRELSRDTPAFSTPEGTFREQSRDTPWGLMEGTRGEVFEDTPGGLTEGATAGGVGLKEKKKQKPLDGASKKLSVVSDKLKFFLKETAGRGNSVQQKLDKIESNKAEVEKALSDHVQYLHSLLDYYLNEQQELLRQQHRDFLQQLMVSKTEELNFEARLKDVQKKVDDALQRITKDHDVTTASGPYVDDLCDEYHRRVSSRPAKRDHSLTYLVEIPQVTADEIQALSGHYIFQGPSPDPRPSRPYPAPSWPGYEDMPAAPAASSKAGSTSSSSSSQRSATSRKTADPAKHLHPKASTGGPDSAKHPLPAGNPPTSSLRFSKENRAKTKASSVELSHSQCSASSVQPKEWTSSLGSKQKQSEVMASSSSIASTGSMSTSKAKKRTRSRKRQKEKKAEARKDAVEPPKPLMITLQHERSRPKKIDGRLKQARGFATRPNGELWVVYGDRDPHLDRINEDGDMLESYRIGGNAMQAASFSEEHVLVAFHSPFCQLQLLDAQKESRETIKLPLIPTGLGVGSTGIAVSGYRCIYWISLDGGKNEWIVKEKGSTLKDACSCDVIILHGREIVCVADRDGHKVWFFEKLDSGEFTPLPLFTYASQSHQGKTVPFSPMCLSTLAGSSFLAVLDDASHSVLMVNVEKNEVVSVIGGKELCDGVPSLISFALTNPGEDPKLWVASNSEFIYLLSLAFLY